MSALKLATRARLLTRGPSSIATRSFGAYAGQAVSDQDLVKQSDDWAIEETNFCLGKRTHIRFSEHEDLAHRLKRIMESQTVRMHTRLRDGTCIPYTAINLEQLADKPCPTHTYLECPLLKWTWDDVYDEAIDDNIAAPPSPQ